MEALLALFAIAVVTWALTALLSPPKKHKNYSLSDQNEAAHRARGGNRPPDATDIVPPVGRKRR